MADKAISEMSPARHVLRDLGFFGHFLHKNAGGRSGQQHTLIKLYFSGGQMTQRELQELMDISSASLSEVLAKLECAGLIERTRSDGDRRTLDITITDEGKRRAETIIEKRQAFEERALTCLSDEEQEQLIVMLDRMVEHWKGIEGEGACV